MYVGPRETKRTLAASKNWKKSYNRIGVREKHSIDRQTDENRHQTVMLTAVNAASVKHAEPRRSDPSPIITFTCSKPISSYTYLFYSAVHFHSDHTE